MQSVKTHSLRPINISGFIKLRLLPHNYVHFYTTQLCTCIFIHIKNELKFMYQFIQKSSAFLKNLWYLKQVLADRNTIFSLVNI